MISEYRNKALLGVVGSIVGATALILFRYQVRQFDPGGGLIMLGILFLLGVYIWGCACLAKAKGHSTAIVLSVVLGVLFPLIVLLVLPDKQKRRHRQHQH